MNPRLALRPVEPIGTEHTEGFVMRSSPEGGRRCGFMAMDLPTYPESPDAEELRRLRIHEADLTLREAARRLGLTPTELSSLERGSATFADPGGWELARTLLLTPAP